MKRLTQWLAPPLALLILGGVLFFTAQNMKAQLAGPPPGFREKPQYPEVSVVRVTPGSYKATITGLGETQPHYSLALVAEVSGRVEEISPGFETGNILHLGDVLVRVEDTEYITAVATAESSLAESRLDLLEEERQVAQAKSEWDSSGLDGEPESELVLRQPQLAAARATVATGRAELAQAKTNLAKTTVTAPFDCLVVSRDVAPGSYLQAGTEIGSLYSIDKLEIAVALSASEWVQLPPSSEIAGHPATVTSVETGRTWQGKVNRVENHVDTTTRQRTVIVEVESPLAQTRPLLAGTFVNVEIEGDDVGNLWKLPGSALSQRGEIWYLTEDGLLANFQAEPVFSDHDAVYVQAPEALSMTQQKILVQPLSSYLVGMKVNPVEVAADEQS